jgi:metal-responsive CopG/Arc/MetJ family transcriptional regulator
MPNTKTAISIERELLEWADDQAKRKRVSRSQLVADALQALRRSQEDEELAASIEAAYADGLDAEEEAWLEASSRSFAEIVDEWK